MVMFEKRGGFLEWAKETLGVAENDMIKKYVKELLEEIRHGETNLHQWMREDLLISERYSLEIDGEKIPLNEMLFGEKSLYTKRNIIVVSGKKYIGKKSFVRKLAEACGEGAEDKIILGRAVKRGNYRIPIVINYEWYNKYWETEPSLEELIESVIKEKLNNNLGERERSILQRDIENLLVNGRFFVYFEGECWLRKMEEKLANILRRGEIVKEYDRDAIRRNLVILTVNDEADIQNSFLNEKNSISITLKELSEEEVLKYLNNTDFNNQTILLKLCKDNPEILRMLQYPDHLRMVGELDNENLIMEEHEEKLKNKFDFYDFFIRAKIRKKLNERKSGREQSRENKIYKELQQYALELYVGGEAKPIREYNFFYRSDYRECGILDENMQFCFTICGYYLAARELCLKLEKHELDVINEVFLEEPLEDILIMTSEMIKEIQYFTEFWNLLRNNGSCKLLLLARIVSKSRYAKEYVADVYRKAFENLQKDFYDYTVLEMFEELDKIDGTDGVERDHSVYLKKEYLSLNEEYDQKEIDNIKKRVIYFLGISHKGIIEQMLKELMEDDTDKHLKYHIIRAAVENYNTDENSTRLINDNMGKLIDYCAGSKDPIIKSDFSVLYKKVYNREWSTGEADYEINLAVKKMMDSDVYWERAHAAGAIGRKNIPDAVELLLGQIEKELDFIYKQKEGYRNSIKVISYSVEAICEMNDRGQGESGSIIERLLQCLDLERLGDQDIEDAYATIATGIEYLINGDSKKLPFNLGGRFRNHAISYQKVLLNTFRQLLNDDVSEEGEIEEMTIEKIAQLEKRMYRAEKQSRSEIKANHEGENKIRILQLTDFHIVNGRSADDNVLIKAIKRDIKDINILLITGDLKQYGNDYSETNKVLEELKENFGLSPKDIFMVPGNHDNNEYEDKSKIFKEIRDNIYKDKECYIAKLPNLYQGFSEYEKFLNKFYGWDYIKYGGIHNEVLTWKDKLNIVCMNTALLCDENTDALKIVDINELSYLNTDNKLPTICISHHKLSQLFEDHKKIVGNILEQLGVRVVFSGDIHKSSVELYKLQNKVLRNYICGKFLGDSKDQWSSREIAVYEVDVSRRKMIPYLYQFQDGSLIPAYNFKKRTENIDEWENDTVSL